MVHCCKTGDVPSGSGDSDVVIIYFEVLVIVINELQMFVRLSVPYMNY